MEKRSEQEELPVFRTWLCGAFRVERRTATGYEAVPTAEWGGSNYPRLLLKALLCCPGRQARREALLELLWPDTAPEQAAQYLNTATTKLRKVLQPAKGQESLLFTESDSTAYRLAPQSALWVDADEGLALLREAERRGRTLPEALPLLERAADSFTQGAFLQDEEGQWVAGRRATVEQARYRCRLWLAEAYEQQGMPGQAETTLSLLLEEDPTDEDVLCRLMGILHRQGMTHQALRLYQRSCELYAREGLELTEATKRVAEQLAHSDKKPGLPETFSAFLSQTGEQNNVPVLLPQALASVIIAAVQELRGQDMDTTRRQILQHALGLAGATLITPVSAFLHPDSVERLTQALAGPSTIDETVPRYLGDERILDHLEQLNAICWNLGNSNQLDLVRQILPTYLPKVAAIAKQSSVSQSQARAAVLAARGYILAAEVEKTNVVAMQAYARQALLYSHASQDFNTQGDALRQEATIALVAKQPLKALHIYQRAIPLLDHLSPLLRSRIYLGLASSSARCGQKQDALRYLDLAQEHFPTKPEDDANYLYMYTSGSRSVLYLYEALTYSDLKQPADAWKSLMQVDGLHPRLAITESARIEFINLQAKTSAMLDNMEESCLYLQAGVMAADAAGYAIWRQEAVDIYRQDVLGRWPHESRVKQLGELFL